MDNETYKSLKEKRGELRDLVAKSLASADKELYSKTRQELFRVEGELDREHSRAARVFFGTIAAFLIVVTFLYFSIFYGIVGAYEAIKNNSRPSYLEFLSASALGACVVTFVFRKLNRRKQK